MVSPKIARSCGAERTGVHEIGGGTPGSSAGRPASTFLTPTPRHGIPRLPTITIYIETRQRATRKPHTVVPWVLAGFLLASLWLTTLSGVLPAAEGATWDVGLTGCAGSDCFQIQFQVDLPHAGGSTTVFLKGVPVIVSLTQVGLFEEFSLTTNFSTVYNGAPAQVSAGGSATVNTSNLARAAIGVVNGAIIGIDSPFTVLIAGGFFARTSLVKAGEVASGEAEVETPFGLQTLQPGMSVPECSTITPRPNQTVEIYLGDSSKLKIRPGTVFTTSCGDPTLPQRTLYHLKGVIEYGIRCFTGGGCYRIRTPNIKGIGVRGTEFSIEYSQPGLIGTSTFRVQSGEIEVTDRQGVSTLVGAGQTFVVTDTVPRVTLILPADEDLFIQGMTNTLSWTAFEGAIGYLLEFTLDPPGFSQPNALLPEFPDQTELLMPGAFTQAEDAVRLPFFVPAGSAPPGTRVQWRSFPVDAAGRILPGTTASDAFTVVLDGPSPATEPANRLLNPGFEEGRVDWIEFSRSGFVLIVNDAPNAHEGSWYAWLGGYDIAEEHIYQDVTIPADATHASLQFWYRITTSETFGCFDRMVVEARRPSDDGLLGILATFCNSDSTNGWTQSGPHGPYDVTSLRGQTIRLRFYTTTDGSLPSSFFVDDVALMINGG